MYRFYLFIILTLLPDLAFPLNIEKSFEIPLPSTFETIADYAALLDYETETVLFSKNGENAMIPSSMSKLMTIYIAFHQLKSGAIKLDDRFTVSEKAWKTGGSRMFLDLGSSVSVEDLLRGIIVQSGNDASIALAEGITGSEEVFVHYMNEAAKELGLKNSHFTNATGWPDPGHRTSAIDLTKLAAALIKNFPEYYHYFNEKTFTYNKISQENRNALLGVGGVDGLKTGHTDDGGYGIIASALKSDRRLIAVVNGLKNNKERSREADRLLTYGFNNFQYHIFAKAGAVITQVPIWNGADLFVNAVISEDLKVLFPRNVAREKLTTSVKFKEPLTAPIKQGEFVGILHIMNGEQIIKSVNLYSLSDIGEANVFKKFWRNLKTIFGFDIHQ
ncbi:MAG: D-alanyl-D-alanine carboxypeptidase [Candidatus Midichloria mitochondrii]|uniref:serine-type D-Ala-D-Ala carboxypeptidase n=1 Tax=Midichloria mitochondrii (strain IricVA) TaxID=696127 RepID=F7XWS7_MIDMI|nr:D-alanyl-D-alanine carboxypeptidase [Candidatus Midichloria mitochondrii IricVA]MDJ1313074.1 D-alanyl-D-alanine carboxypeptidase [Candidatus Midichloria mitochondrii]